MLGREYHQSRGDVWAMCALDLDTYLKDWAARQKALGAGKGKESAV